MNAIIAIARFVFTVFLRFVFTTHNSTIIWPRDVTRIVNDELCGHVESRADCYFEGAPLVRVNTSESRRGMCCVGAGRTHGFVSFV